MKMTGNGETGLRSEMGESMLAMVQGGMENRFVTMGGLLSWDAPCIHKQDVLFVGMLAREQFRNSFRLFVYQIYYVIQPLTNGPRTFTKRCRGN